MSSRYDGHTLGMYGVEMMQSQFLLFSLCFFTMDSAGNDTLSHCFPCLPSSSSSMLHCILIFIDLISCFSHPGLCCDKLVVLRDFTFQAVPVFHSLDLFQLTCFIYINFIIFSFPAASTSSSISPLSWTCGLQGFHTCVSHSFILIYLWFFLQGSWNYTRVILPIFIFMSS